MQECCKSKVQVQVRKLRPPCLASLARCTLQTGQSAQTFIVSTCHWRVVEAEWAELGPDRLQQGSGNQGIRESPIVRVDRTNIFDLELLSLPLFSSFTSCSSTQMLWLHSMSGRSCQLPIAMAWTCTHRSVIQRKLN